MLITEYWIRMAGANPAQAAAEPGVAEPGVNLDRLVEGNERIADSIVSGEEEAVQRMGLGVARAVVDGVAGGVASALNMAEAEFQLSNSRPGEAKCGRALDRLAGGLQCGAKIVGRLVRVGKGQ